MKNLHQLKLARLMLASSRLKSLKQEPMRPALRKPVQLKSTSHKSESSKMELVKSATVKVVPERLDPVKMVPFKSFMVRFIRKFFSLSSAPIRFDRANFALSIPVPQYHRILNSGYFKGKIGWRTGFKPASKNRLEELYKSHFFLTQTTHRG